MNLVAQDVFLRLYPKLQQSHAGKWCVLSPAGLESSHDHMMDAIDEAKPHDSDGWIVRRIVPWVLPDWVPPKKSSKKK